MQLPLVLWIAPLVLGAPAMDRSISGKGVEKYYDSVYDATRKVYLHSGGECDGAHIRLVLSADLDAILLNEGTLHHELNPRERAERRAEAKRAIRPGSINPATNQGIRLGMTKPQVIKILGTPRITMFSKKFKADELIYRRESKKDKDGVSVRYSNYYLFRGGRLFYIELARDLMGAGC